MLQQAILGVIRTAVPTLVGTIVTWLLAHGINLDPNSQQALITVLVGVLTAVYYFLVTLLERKVNPAFGWLLGAAKAPSYDGQEPYAGLHRDAEGGSINVVHCIGLLALLLAVLAVAGVLSWGPAAVVILAAAGVICVVAGNAINRHLD